MFKNEECLGNEQEFFLKKKNDNNLICLKENSSSIFFVYAKIPRADKINKLF